MLKALIIDDEPLAHEVILHHLTQHSDISIVGRCYNATQALKYIPTLSASCASGFLKFGALLNIRLIICSNTPKPKIIKPVRNKE